MSATYIYIYILCVCVCVCVCVSTIHINIYTHNYVHTIYIYIYTHVFMYVCMYVCMYVHAHTDTHTHTHTLSLTLQTPASGSEWLRAFTSAAGWTVAGFSASISWIYLHVSSSLLASFHDQLFEPSHIHCLAGGQAEVVNLPLAFSIAGVTHPVVFSSIKQLIDHTVHHIIY